MAKAKLCIQCTDETSGKTGDFLAEPQHGIHRAISPIFAGLAPLYDWCKANGWKATPFSPEFPVGLYEQ